MQEERERGRIAGLRVRRRETANWASSFIPLLAEARGELPIYADTGEPSRQAYANWLNDEDRRVPTRRGGAWTSETVRRLFDIHIGLIDDAEQEFDIAIAIIRFKWRYADAVGQEALAVEEASVRHDRARAINDAYRLSAQLRGHVYLDQEIPERLRATSPRARKQPRSSQAAAPVQSAPPNSNTSDQPEEVQLSLL